MAFYTGAMPFPSSMKVDSQSTGPFPDNISSHGRAAIENAKVAEPQVAADPLAYKRRAPDSIDSKYLNYGFKNYHYPKDLLGADNMYGGNYVVFYINVQNASRIRVDGGQIRDTDTMPPGTSASSSGLRSNVQLEKIQTNTSEKTQQIVAGVGTSIGMAAISKALGVSGGESTAAIAVNTAGITTVISQAGTLTRETKRLRVAIALHMPNQLAVSYSVDWEGADIANQLILSNKFGGEGQINMLKGAKIAALAKTFTASPAGNMLSAQTGQAANSKKEMMFKNTNFRSFTFDYKFAPRDQDELLYVQNIIKMFKFHMHPEYEPDTGNFLYIYPSEFDILYYHDNTENMNIHRHTSCVLASMNVSYTPNGNFAAFKDGSAIEISMSLQFKELAQLTKENIADGY